MASASQTGNGVEEYSGIAPGHYELQTGPPRRILDIDATADRQITADAGALAAGFHASLRPTSGGELPPQPVLFLTRSDQSYSSETQGIPCLPEGCNLEALSSGEWKMSVMNGEHFLPIVSVAINGRIRSGNLITANDKPLDVLLTVADATVRIEGFARKDGKGKAGVMVLLVPQNPAAHSDLYRRDQSDSDGSFVLRDVSPGAYTLIAIENGWDLEWQRPEVLARFLPHGITVSIPGLRTNSSTMHLATFVPVQSADVQLATPANPAPETPSPASSKQGGEDRP